MIMAAKKFFWTSKCVLREICSLFMPYMMVLEELFEEFQDSHHGSHLKDFINSESPCCPDTVNSEILARILFSRIALKDIFGTFKICDLDMI